MPKRKNKAPNIPNFIRSWPLWLSEGGMTLRFKTTGISFRITKNGLLTCETAVKRKASTENSTTSPSLARKRELLSSRRLSVMQLQSKISRSTWIRKCKWINQNTIWVLTRDVPVVRNDVHTGRAAWVLGACGVARVHVKRLPGQQNFCPGHEEHRLP